jgi:hypothetical protein
MPLGVGVEIGIGVEKAADQRPIPMPIATQTPIRRGCFFLQGHQSFNHL